MIDNDFIPADYHEDRHLRRAAKTRSGFVGILIAIMVLWVVVNRHELSSAEAMLTEIGQQRGQITEHLVRKAKMEAERARLRDSQQLIEQLGGRTSLVVVFGEISRRLPKTVVITDMSLAWPTLSQYVVQEEPIAETPKRQNAKTPKRRKPRVQRPDSRLERAQLTLTGIASTAPHIIEFAAALESSPLIDQVRTEAKGETTWAGRKAQKFELTCNLVAQRGASS